MFTFGSLFSGVGGFDLGFERAGMSCLWQVEIDAKCQAVLERHWPNVRRYGDVREVQGLDSVDLICGGFPCQDVSVAGKREGLAGERSGLWFEFHRVLAELAPGWVVIENVPGLLSSNGGRDFAVILYGLADLGYRVCWRVLDSQYFGVAQRRRRVFIIGYLGDGRAAQVLFESESGTWDPPPSREAEQKVAPPVKASTPSRRNGESWPIAEEFVIARPLAHGSRTDHYDESQQTYVVASQTVSPSLTCEGHDASENGRGRKAFTIAFALGNLVRRAGESPNTEVFGTLGAEKQGDMFPHVAYNWQSGGDVRHSFGLPNLSANQVPAVGVRRLTPTECERLQNFPDGWTSEQSDSSRYRQMGNAVTVSVIEWIGKRIMEIEGWDD